MQGTKGLVQAHRNGTTQNGTNNEGSESQSWFIQATCEHTTDKILLKLGEFSKLVLKQEIKAFSHQAIHQTYAKKNEN